MSFGVQNYGFENPTLAAQKFAIRVMFLAKIRTAQPLLAYTNIYVYLRKHREMRKRPLLILLKVSPGYLCFMNENKYRYISQTPGEEFCIPPKQPPVPPSEMAKGFYKKLLDQLYFTNIDLTNK